MYLSLPAVIHLTGREEYELLTLMIDGIFPRPRRGYFNTCGWLESDIVAWTSFCDIPPESIWESEEVEQSD